ncbi:hypothetical protein J4714_13605 [Staphylococcus epidermidis]|nr:hypothetical protein [Staphylococcus epidermidis]
MLNLSLIHADAGIAHGNEQGLWLVCIRIAAGDGWTLFSMDTTTSLMGELGGIAHQIVEDLAQAQESPRS